MRPNNRHADAWLSRVRIGKGLRTRLDGEHQGPPSRTGREHIQSPRLMLSSAITHTKKSAPLRPSSPATS